MIGLYERNEKIYLIMCGSHDTGLVTERVNIFGRKGDDVSAPRLLSVFYVRIIPCEAKMKLKESNFIH